MSKQRLGALAGALLFGLLTADSFSTATAATRGRLVPSPLSERWAPRVSVRSASGRPKPSRSPA